MDPRDWFDKSKYPSGCWVDEVVPCCSCCICKNSETCDSMAMNANWESVLILWTHSAGRSITLRTPSNHALCFVNPDYACDGDLGYGCRPKIGNWLTVKFVQNPGYEHGPRICGPKCQEVVLIGAGDFEWLFKTNNDGLKGCIVAKMILPTEERGALWSAPPSGIAPLPDVDHMAECQPDPSL